ncbi:MAG: HupE/UreJ family protein [Microcoleaceae cyanobacterium]
MEGKKMNNLRDRVLLGLSFSAFFTLDLLLTKPAEAHHAMGGKIPNNFFEGFLSGLAHPIIGLDHFAFIVAMGLLAIGHRWALLIPASFVMSAMTGTLLHVMRVDLPFSEVTIALSVIIVGVMLARKNNLSTIILAIGAGFAGLFHGYAYGESIIGAQITPLFAYLGGFTVIQFLVAILAFVAGDFVQQKWENPNASKVLQFSGVAISLIGGLFLTRAISL